MALTETTEYDKIEVVGIYKAVQVRKANVIKKDDAELTRSFERYVLDSDADVSKEPAEVQAICNAVWTDAIKDSWKKKQEADKIGSEIIPNLLAEQGLSSLKLADGSSVDIRKSYNCTIKKDQVESAFEWLRNNGLGDLIKNEVAVQFGKGEDNKAEQLLGLAVREGYEPSQKQKVEPMTLKALFRERIEAGLDMPSDFFHTFVKDQTKIGRKS